MERKVIEYMCIGAAINDKEKTMDLIASQGINLFRSAEAKEVMQAINNVYAERRNCDYDLLISEMIKQKYNETLEEFSKYSNTSFVDYNKYKNDLKEIDAKEYIFKKTWEVLGNTDISVNELVESLNFKEYKTDKDTASLLVDVKAEGIALMEKSEQRLKNEELWGIRTGMKGIDKRINEIQAGELVVVSAEPSTGKSVLALDVAIHNTKRGKNCIFISQEMSASVISKRALCCNSLISQNVFNTYNPKQKDFDDMYKTIRNADAIDNLKIVGSMKKCSYSDVYTVTQSIKRASNWENVDLIVIDYLQYMSAEKESNTEYETIKENIKQLAEMSKELNCVVMVISSLNQSGKLEGAATIKFAADHIWFLSKVQKGDGDIKQDVMVGEYKKINFAVEKNRNGETFRTNILLDGAKSKFYEMEG
jgi:replicative DNA helicase